MTDFKHEMTDVKHELLKIRRWAVKGPAGRWPEAIERVVALGVGGALVERDVRLIRAVGCMRQLQGAEAASAAKAYLNWGGTWNELEGALLSTPEAHSLEFVTLVAELQGILEGQPITVVSSDPLFTPIAIDEDEQGPLFTPLIYGAIAATVGVLLIAGAVFFLSQGEQRAPEQILKQPSNAPTAMSSQVDPASTAASKASGVGGTP